MKNKVSSAYTSVHTFSASYILPVTVFLLALASRLIPGARTIDDAFITFRYARNILAGNGFGYNPGEHVLGTTTPLYTILLSTLGLLTGGEQASFPQIAIVVNAVADAFTCLLLLNLGRRLASPQVGLGAALVWAIAPSSVTFAIGGLETSLYVLLLTGTISAYLQRRPLLTALLGALALLTRPDALLLLGPLGLDRLLSELRNKRNLNHEQRPGVHCYHLRPLFKEAILFSLILLPWVIFATVYFGSPIPHSIAAKSLVYRLPPEAALVRLIQHYATPFQDNLTFGTAGIGFGLILYPFLYLVGALNILRRERRSWPFLIYPWLYLAVFAAANPLIFRWYLTPPLPAYILFILLGADQLVTDLWRKIKPRVSDPFQPALLRVMTVVFIILIPMSLISRNWTLHPEHGLQHPAPDMAWYELELLYHQAAVLLEPHLGVNTVLAASDIGVLGYYTPARILDTVGLISTQALQYYPLDPKIYEINYAIAPELILAELPDYIVILEIYGRSGLLKDPRFVEKYQLIDNIPTDIYGSEGMLIFARQDRP